MSENINIEDSIKALEWLESLSVPIKAVKAAYQHAKDVDIETQRRSAELKQAEAATSQAKRQVTQYEKQIAEQRGEIERLAEQKSNLIDEGTERAKISLVTVKTELDKMRMSAANQKKQLTRELTDLTATIEQKKKEIAKLEQNRRDLTGGAQQIEANAIAVSEAINRNKLSLERDVGNLQAQKLTLNSEVKRLEARFEEIKGHEAERKQAAEAAHRAKQELAAMQAQLEATRQDMRDLAKTRDAIKEEVAAAAETKAALGREMTSLQAHTSSLKRESSKLEKKLDAARHREVAQRQAAAAKEDARPNGE